MRSETEQDVVHLGAPEAGAGPRARKCFYFAVDGLGKTAMKLPVPCLAVGSGRCEVGGKRQNGLFSSKSTAEVVAARVALQQAAPSSRRSRRMRR